MSATTIFTIDGIRWDFVNPENPHQGVMEAPEQQQLRSRQVELWNSKKASHEIAKLVSSITFLYSSVILPYAIKHQEKKGTYILTLVGLVSALSTLVAGRASKKATEQIEAWSIPMDSRAAAQAFWDHFDRLEDKHGMTTERYIQHLLQGVKKKTPPQNERAIKISLLLNLFKSRFWKKST